VQLEATIFQLSNRFGFVQPPDIPIILMLEDEAAYRRVVYALGPRGATIRRGLLADSLPSGA